MLFTKSPPKLDLGKQQAPQVLLVYGLACDSKGFGHL